MRTASRKAIKLEELIKPASKRAEMHPFEPSNCSPTSPIIWPSFSHTNAQNDALVSLGNDRLESRVREDNAHLLYTATAWPDLRMFGDSSTAQLVAVCPYNAEVLTSDAKCLVADLQMIGNTDVICIELGSA